MIKQLSFTKYMRELQPDFRCRINQAESEEELRNIFFQTVRGLFEVFLAGGLPCEPLDIRLLPDERPPYSLSPRLRRDRNFRRVWANSDLAPTVAKLAEAAAHRWRHLGMHPEKTTAKIRAQQAAGRNR